MNFFFGIESPLFKSRLFIPRFQNKNNKNTDYSLFEINIFESLWQFTNREEFIFNNNFYKIDYDQIDNHKIYCLASETEISKMDKNQFTKLISFNDFTETSPAFRANLEISIINGGFSSYQSDYPYSMIEKKGNILSSINSLANSVAETNRIYFKNIYELPINKEFDIFFVDIEKRKVLKKVKALTNKTNEIEIEKKYIKPNIYLFSEKYIGIPIYVSIDNNHISMEHTHPPHEYILSKDRFRIVSDKKNEIYEIIKKNI